MKTGWMKKSLCLFCLGLSVALATVAAAQTETPSVLDRVQSVEDPELGELIRVAMENHSGANTKESLEIMRKVTQSYAQIKLLDRQIKQVSRKIEKATGPAEMRYELLLAKSELESKLMTELANLREVMGIIPKHAFEKQPLETLNALLALNVIGQRIYALDGLKPFSGYWAAWRFKSAGLLSERETLNYIRERLADKRNLPIRIDVYYTPETKAMADDLRSKIISLAAETRSQMQVELRLELSTWVGSGESTFFLRDGKIRTFYPAPVKRPDGGPKPLVSGVVNPNDLEQSILWRLTMPKNVPLRFHIEYDEASALVAKQVAEAVRAVAKRLGVADVVAIKETLVEPVPEARFLGRWQTVADSEIREIELQAGGQSQLTMKAGARKTVPAPWTLGTKDIFIDSAYLITYRGYINAEGNLVVDKGEIWPHGSWHDRGEPEMVFKKVN
jgi:hypothetical protein